MRRISWILTLPLTVVVIFFSVANRGLVELDLWPLAEGFSVPVFVLLLGGLFVGFLAGGLVMWLSGAKGRRRARNWRYKSGDLEREVARLKREVDRAKQRTEQPSTALSRDLSRTSSSVPAVSPDR